MTHWDDVCADLAHVYGVHEYQHQNAPWTWLRGLIYALPAYPNTFTRALVETS